MPPAADAPGADVSRLVALGCPAAFLDDVRAGRIAAADLEKWIGEYRTVRAGELGKWGWGKPSAEPKVPPMKCLSLWQPWASLLVAGRKLCETRGWPLHHRGPLLIHAAKKMDADIRLVCMSEPFKTVLAELDLTAGTLPLGAVVGRVDVVECYPTEAVELTAADVRALGQVLEITRAEEAFGDFSPGRFAFLCRNPVRFDKPVPVAGRQGLFDVAIPEAAR